MPSKNRDSLIVTEDIFNTILENKKNQTTCIIKNFCSDVPLWSDFVDYIGESSSQDSIFSEPLPEYDLNLDGKIVGNVIIKQNFYLYMVIHRHIGKSQNIESEFQFFIPSLSISNLYVNLSNTIDDIPDHIDALDNFYWQCQGSVEWKANGNTYNVEPGDLVYIPAKTHHSVNFSMPRAAIGFSGVINV